MRQSGQVVGDADAVMKDVLRDLRDVTPAPTGQDYNEADKVCRSLLFIRQGSHQNRKDKK